MLVKVKVKLLSHVGLFATPWTVAHQAPPSIGFSRQEHWSGLPFPSPGNLPDPGIEPRSPAFQAVALTSEPPEKPLYVGRYCQILIHKIILISSTQDYIRLSISPYSCPCGILSIFKGNNCHSDG